MSTLYSIGNWYHMYHMVHTSPPHSSSLHLTSTPHLLTPSPSLSPPHRKPCLVLVKAHHEHLSRRQGALAHCKVQPLWLVRDS